MSLVSKIMGSVSFPGVSVVRNPLPMQEPQKMWVWALDQDYLEKEMAIHSSIFAWEIPWTEEPGGLQSMGLKSVGLDRKDWAGTHTGGQTSEGTFYKRVSRTKED